MATKPTPKKSNPFAKPDTPKNEAAERRLAPTKKAYMAAERKYEGKRGGKC